MATWQRIKERCASDPVFAAAYRARMRAKQRRRWARDAAYRARKRDYKRAVRADPVRNAALNAQRRAWEAQRHAPPLPDLPAPYTGHPLLDTARQIAGPAWYGDSLYDPTKEDAAGEVVLALLAGDDPVVAVKRFYHQHRLTTYYERAFSALPPTLHDALTEGIAA